MFHKSNFGSFGEHLWADLDGYVPQEGDKPEQFRWAGDQWELPQQPEGLSAEEAEEWREEEEEALLEEWEEWIAGSGKAVKEAEEALAAWRADEYAGPPCRCSDHEEAMEMGLACAGPM